MKVVFMGTPDFSVPALDALIEAGHEVVCVYCQPARPAGRGKKPRPSPVETRARELGLEVRSPVSLKGEDEQAAFVQLGADVAVVVAYGLLLPQVILDGPELGCVNIHASLLPRWRGAAPIHRAIMAGDARTGVSIMQMEAGLDTGPVLLCEAVDIAKGETTGDLHDRLSQLGAGLICKALESAGDWEPQPQPESGVTYARKIDKAEARIDWRRSADEVDRLIRGLSPFPGAWTDMDGERVKVLRSRVVDGSGEPGQVLDGFRVACGEGAIEVTLAQRAGKRAMVQDEFLRGVSLPDCFG